MTISIRLTPDLRNKLQKMADDQERTLSWLCMKILRDAVKQAESEPAK